MIKESLISNTAAWQDSAANEAWDAIESRGLTHHLQELLNYGLTIIPPEAISIDNHLERIPHYRAQENFHGRISQEMKDRNSARFAELVGEKEVWGFTDKRGPLTFDAR